ncbi:hypothetical protein E2562_012339 [Oryza meyeriana var. granulata]|uniref:F-box domain-containing protein n=1 Tax=Oryza meyeriana var. granulata TaxID=110450 RepID=A0A6G1DH83_9ORYZ|nr:hypothetical protein E2562_012339 [Oryza meyeriana var. granulata]
MDLDGTTHDDDDDVKFELLCDDLLEFILLRLDSPICLVRAASVCKRWRHVIADAGFLRRICSLHRPTVAGLYSVGHQASPIREVKLRPIFIPSPSVAAAIDHRRHLSPVFLYMYRRILDSCGSLLLLEPRLCTFQDITVYEPFTRLYRLINPPAPRESGHCSVVGAYLLGGGDADDEAAGCAAASMSNFRVVCTFYDHHDRAAHASVLDQRNFIGRAGGSLYWATRDGKVHVLNGITMETSTFTFPDNETWSSSLCLDIWLRYYHNRVLRVVDCGGGAARMVCFAGLNLEVFSRPRGGEKWAPEKSVRLPENTLQFVPEGLEGYYVFDSLFETMVTAGAGFVVFAPSEDAPLLFQIDLETEVVTFKLKDRRYNVPQFPCELPWPPALHACV